MRVIRFDIWGMIAFENKFIIWIFQKTFKRSAKLNSFQTISNTTMWCLLVEKHLVTNYLHSVMKLNLEDLHLTSLKRFLQRARKGDQTLKTGLFNKVNNLTTFGISKLYSDCWLLQGQCYNFVWLSIIRLFRTFIVLIVEDLCIYSTWLG